MNKYFKTAVGLFILSFLGQFIFITFDDSGWATLFMMPFIFLHPLFLAMFVVLNKLKYQIAYFFPSLVVIDWLMFILAADFFENVMPSYFIFSFFFNILN